jgi:hypothetical protein
MKQMIVFAAFIFCAGVLQAQIQGDSERTKNFSFTDSTTDQKLYFTVTEGTPIIKFRFNVTLAKGRLSFVVTDPEGKKCGNFNLDRGSKGELSDSEDKPVPGKWVVSLTLKHATGNLSYEVKMNDN